MLTPHPDMLKSLLERYETLRALHAANPTPDLRQRMNDTAYTLCVTTGTRDVDTAVVIARRQLDASLGTAP
jgi:hypothetical protein